MSGRKNRRSSKRGAVIMLCLICAILVCFFGLWRLGRERAREPEQSASETVTVSPSAPESAAIQPAATAAPAVTATPIATPEPTASPEPEPTARPMTELERKRAETRPTATAPGFLPVFARADTDEKIIAVTVDDCFQAENLQKIVDMAISVGGKLTIFPIGQNAVRTEQAAILKYAWEQGFELENHTWTHNGLYRCSGEEMAEEIYHQQMGLCSILGVEYQCHFLRPKGGDARRDQRLQKYAEQMGYYGIAHWAVSGMDSLEIITAGLKPGAIFLFHTTDKDWEKLQYFIPWAVSQGYQLVTLNEMFGYPPNETSELTDDPLERVAPTPAPFERVLVPYKQTSYAWGVYLLQEKLIELGYLSGEPDGIYGADSAAAVERYQRDHGLEATGEADVATQENIFGM